MKVVVKKKIILTMAIGLLSYANISTPTSLLAKLADDAFNAVTAFIPLLGEDNLLPCNEIHNKIKNKEINIEFTKDNILERSYPEGNTPLMTAILSKNFDAVKKLLGCRGKALRKQLGCKNANGDTPMHVAMKLGNMAHIELVYKAAKKAMTPDEETPLVSKPINFFKIKNKFGKTPAQCASKETAQLIRKSSDKTISP